MKSTQYQKFANLEQRMLRFAKNVRSFTRKIPKSVGNTEDSKQLIKSSGSVGSRYIDANESANKMDFVQNIRISKKESKESSYWLGLLDTQQFDFLDKERGLLAKESDELTKILGSILGKCKTKRVAA